MVFCNVFEYLKSLCSKLDQVKNVLKKRIVDTLVNLENCFERIGVYGMFLAKLVDVKLLVMQRQISFITK